MTALRVYSKLTLLHSKNREKIKSYTSRGAFVEISSLIKVEVPSRVYAFKRHVKEKTTGSSLSCSLPD